MSKTEAPKTAPKPKGSTTFIIEGKEFTLSKPTRQIYERVIPLVTPIGGHEPQFIRAGEIILKSCWIDGDDEIQNDDELFISACIQACNLIQIKEAEIKKN